jgi:probable H4MPT-linked C1 transfer pathway protein
MTERAAQGTPQGTPGRTLGVDVGGANLKVADSAGRSASEAFPMWKESDRLTTRLTRLFERASAFERLAVTMTGELADCFPSKTVGVAFIVDATLAAAGERPVRFYSQRDGWIEGAAAKERVLDVAAANWHATATFAGRFAPTGSALFIDAGSTTVDVIPLEQGQAASVGRTDTERLLSGELVYSGVERTPLFALNRVFRYRGRECPVAAELFATTADAYLLLGRLPEDAESCDTANGKPRTRVETIRRLARTFCADELEFHETDAVDLAEQVQRRQTNLIAEAILRATHRLNGPVQTVILAGHGSFLVRPALNMLKMGDATVVDFAETIGAEASRAASAYALACLAEETWK